MIWLLEDDDNIRKLLRFSLERERYPVREFADPSSFWEGLRSEIPELIFLDILLPEENGFHILERLRQTEETARIPVIVLTAMDGEYDRVFGLDLGADDYIVKNRYLHTVDKNSIF